ncbi:hypothetical protein EKH55_3697 [Sinorhizobium alkalisoli]|nr:hypothetical protein EKH55_3697 [Sinorhizobium alkalisoli]
MQHDVPPNPSPSWNHFSRWSHPIGPAETLQRCTSHQTYKDYCRELLHVFVLDLTSVQGDMQ